MDRGNSIRRPFSTGRIAVFAVVALCVPTVLHGQHPTGSTVPGVQYEGCNLCHGPHVGGRSDGYNLRAGDSGGMATAPGLGAASRSCLRCHSSVSERLRQPEFSGSSVAGVDGRFLQYDLSDDHPLGQIQRNSILDDGTTLEDPTRALRGSSALGRFDEVGKIECTLCHDPHEEYSIVPGPEEQKILCGSCHDAATYSLESHASLACGNCHSLHGGHTGDLLAEPTSTILCQSCHETGGVSASFSMERSASATVALPPAPRGHSRPPEGECTSCHRLHE